MPNAAILLVMGAFSGFLAGTLGAGGGFATVVMLIGAGLTAHEAIGTSLVFTVIVGAWGTAVHLRQGTASPWLALSLGIPSAATAIVGAGLADSLSERGLLLSFGGLTAIVGLVLLISPVRRPGPEALEGDLPPISGAQATHVSGHVRPTAGLVAAAVAGGAAIGLLKGLFGVGGGFLLVPFMVLALRIPERLAVGSSLFAILLGSVAGGIKHATLGNVAADGLWWLVPGGLVAALLGARLVRRLTPRAIRIAFIALMFSSAGYLLGRGL